MTGKTTGKGIGKGWTVLTGAALAIALGFARPAAAEDRSASLQPEQIRIVQRSLADYGYQAAPTGTWDDGTRAALRSFQADNQLRTTGTLDDATAQALGVDPWAVKPVSGKQAIGRQDPENHEVDCAINNTVDCRPGGG
jgi:peptidoglycan hydrolase-like protein with peptidoglycan-binding domain